MIGNLPASIYKPSMGFLSPHKGHMVSHQATNFSAFTATKTKTKKASTPLVSPGNRRAAGTQTECMSVLVQRAKENGVFPPIPRHLLLAGDLQLWLTDSQGSFTTAHVQPPDKSTSYHQHRTEKLLEAFSSKHFFFFPRKTFLFFFFNPTRTKGEILFYILAGGVQTLPEEKASSYNQILTSLSFSLPPQWLRLPAFGFCFATAPAWEFQTFLAGIGHRHVDELFPRAIHHTGAAIQKRNQTDSTEEFQTHRVKTGEGIFLL